MKSARLLATIVALAFFAVACRQPPTPPPAGITDAPRSGSGPDWQEVDPTQISRANDPNYQGLERRPGDLNDSFAMDDRVEGILPSVYFAFDQATIRPADRASLQDAASYLEQNPGERLIIEGHCDWRGTTEYNLALGERRAASAREYLISLGIAADRIETVSMGDREASQTDSEAQMEQDRRADLIVVR